MDQQKETEELYNLLIEFGYGTDIDPDEKRDRDRMLNLYNLFQVIERFKKTANPDTQLRFFKRANEILFVPFYVVTQYNSKDRSYLTISYSDNQVVKRISIGSLDTNAQTVYDAIVSEGNNATRPSVVQDEQIVSGNDNIIEAVGNLFKYALRDPDENVKLIREMYNVKALSIADKINEKKIASINDFEFFKIMHKKRADMDYEIRYN